MKLRSALAILVVAGCGCHSPSQYTSPRVEGRVLDEQTQQPIRGVQVRRELNAPPPLDGPRGAEMLTRAPATRTDAAGCFVVESERALSFIGHSMWYSVTLSFTHADYERVVRSYSFSSSTNTASGEPVVPAGEILLRPLAK